MQSLIRVPYLGIPDPVHPINITDLEHGAKTVFVLQTLSGYIIRNVKSVSPNWCCQTLLILLLNLFIQLLFSQAKKNYTGEEARWGPRI